MSPLLLVLVAAALTYLSRLAALALLPAPGGRFAAIVGRAPAPLFAALAVATLLGPDGSMAPPPALAAVAAAVLVAPRRSLALTLLAGVAAYGGVLLLL